MKPNNVSCNHLSSIVLSSLQNKSYCSKCGIIFIESQSGKNNETAKPISYNTFIDSDPFLFLKQMEQYEDEHVLFPPNQWYKQNRNKAILYLKNQCNSFNISEKSLCAALSYLDLVMCFFEQPQLTEKQFALKIVSCFVLAGKFYENDSLSFDLGQFTSFDQQEVFDKNEIVLCEIETIKQLDYRLFNVNLYDYINCVLNCGIVLKDEVDNSEDKLRSIYSYALRLCTKLLFLNIYPTFTYYQIIFSIIYLTRKHFGLNNNVITIKNIFNVFSWEYLSCAEHILNILNKSKQKLIDYNEEKSSEPILYTSNSMNYKDKLAPMKGTAIIESIGQIREKSNEKLTKKSLDNENNNKGKSRKTYKKCKCRISCFNFFNRKKEVVAM